MSNLIKSTSVNLPKEVSNLSRSVFQANSTIMIKDITDMNVVVNSLHQSINRSIADKGINMEVEEINYLKRSVTEDILKDFYTLTLQDVALCFNMGVRGNLGDYYGLNAVTYYGWLKKYKTEVLPQVFKEVGKYVEVKSIEPPKIDHKQLDLEKIDNICSAIKMFEDNLGYDFNDFGNIHYNFLLNNDYFKDISQDILDSIKENSKQQLIADMKSKNSSLVSSGKSYQLTDINKLMENIEYGEKDTEIMIEIIYKKSVLKHFITNFYDFHNNLNEFKTELTNIINTKYEN